jgi:uncharacterized integral membrane protein
VNKGQTNSTVRRQFRGTGLYWNLIIALVVAVAIIIGIIQNSQGVRLKYLGWTVGMPLGVVLLITIVLTVALTSLAGLMWRRQRRHQLTDSVELHELREQAQGRGPTEPKADAPEARNSGAST